MTGATDASARATELNVEVATLRIEPTAWLPVLLYHHVGPPHPRAHPSLTISPAAFRRQIERLERGGFTTIRLEQWHAWRVFGRPLPPRPVVITFDDAYADIAEHALPVLREHRFGAVVFVVTALLGATNTWEEANGFAGMPLMSAEQIREWSSHGIEFGTHTRTHADLCGLDPHRLRQEIAGSREDLEQVLGERVRSFAYPYGHYDGAVTAIAARTYEFAFTCRQGLNTRDTAADLLKRTMVRPSDSMLDFELRLRLGISPVQWALRKLRNRGRKILHALVPDK